MRRILSLAVFSFLVMATSSARAAVVLALDLPTLSRAATVIAEVEVVERESVRLPSGQIITQYLAFVHDGIRGVEHGDELRFFTEGGEVDGVGAWVAGEPRPRLGKRYVAFLRPAGAGLRFVGMSQGCLPVAEGPGGVPFVSPPSQGAHLVVPSPTGGYVDGAGAVESPRALVPFLQEVRALVAR